MRRVLLGLTGIVGVLVAWTLVAAAGVGGAGAVPTPATVFDRIGGLVGDPDFQAAVLATVLAWLLAMLATLVLAVPLGVLLGSAPWLRAGADVLIDVVRPVPAVALLPVGTVLLGAGPQTKIALAVFAGIWPVLFNLSYGLAHLEPQFLDTARGFGLRPWSVVLRVRLPSVLPSLVTGLRLSAALELVVLVSVEYLNGQTSPGIGGYLYAAAQQADLATVLAGALVAGLIGLAINWALLASHRPWFDAAAPTAEPETADWTGRRARFVLRGLVFLAFLVAWQLIAGLLGSPFLPGPLRVVGPFLGLWRDAGSTVLPSLGRIAAGWAIAVVVGIGGGVLFGRRPVLAECVEPVFGFARAVPPVLVVPVAFAFVPIGTPLEITVIAAGSVWPILVNTTDGVRGVHPTLIDTSRAYRIGPVRRVLLVLLPAASARIFAGLRVSLALALILMVVSELVGARDGLGYTLVQAQSLFDYPLMWAAVVLIGLLGYVCNRLLIAAEHRLLPGARAVAN